MSLFDQSTTSGLAVIIGASGGIGQALQSALETEACFEQVIGLSRSQTNLKIDIGSEASILAAAQCIKDMDKPVRLLVIASGFLHNEDLKPEKTYRHLDPALMQHNFLINAMGPALVLKQFLPLMPRQGETIYAAISARVGSISDNHLGGWHSYRASKAALNQIMRTVSIETARINPQSIGVSLHPGTADTNLSKPFQGSKAIQTPFETSQKLLSVLKSLTVAHNGGFYDQNGLKIAY